jgi:hypothetical protein
MHAKKGTCCPRLSPAKIRQLAELATIKLRTSSYPVDYVESLLILPQDRCNCLGGQIGASEALWLQYSGQMRHKAIQLCFAWTPIKSWRCSLVISLMLVRKNDGACRMCPASLLHHHPTLPHHPRPLQCPKELQKRCFRYRESNPALVGAQTWTEESLKATDASRYTIPEALMRLGKNKK